MKIHQIFRLWPLYFLALLAPFTPWLDLYISHLFFRKGEFHDNFFFHFLYEYTGIFCEAIGVFAILCYCLSFAFPTLKKWRQSSFVLILTLIIGAGLLVNVLFKGYWGRPRPKQITEFGGHAIYRPFWKPDFSTKAEPQKSFPSGHVAIGFYFLTFCIIGRRMQKPALSLIGIILSTVIGGGLILARLAQGGHFFSDVLVSPFLMWYVALGIDKWTDDL